MAETKVKSVVELLILIVNLVTAFQQVPSPVDCRNP